LPEESETSIGLGSSLGAAEAGAAENETVATKSAPATNSGLNCIVSSLSKIVADFNSDGAVGAGYAPKIVALYTS
jgi:hypothetical protein